MSCVQRLLFSVLFVAAACTSGNQLSQNAAHIPQPDITIIGRTDMTNIPTVAAGIEAHFEFRIVNQAEVPITLRRIDLDSLGGGEHRRSRPETGSSTPSSRRTRCNRSIS